ncbi:hypothetical protein P7C70_g8634, partial [Phenoliferia sp. Uapishka_3]
MEDTSNMNTAPRRRTPGPTTPKMYPIPISTIPLLRRSSTQESDYTSTSSPAIKSRQMTDSSGATSRQNSLSLSPTLEGRSRTVYPTPHQQQFLQSNVLDDYCAALAPAETYSHFHDLGSRVPFGAVRSGATRTVGARKHVSAGGNNSSRAVPITKPTRKSHLPAPSHSDQLDSSYLSPPSRGRSELPPTVPRTLSSAHHPPRPPDLRFYDPQLSWPANDYGQVYGESSALSHPGGAREDPYSLGGYQPSLYDTPHATYQQYPNSANSYLPPQQGPSSHPPLMYRATNINARPQDAGSFQQEPPPHQFDINAPTSLYNSAAYDYRAAPHPEPLQLRNSTSLHRIPTSAPPFGNDERRAMADPYLSQRHIPQIPWGQPSMEGYESSTGGRREGPQESWEPAVKRRREG